MAVQNGPNAEKVLTSVGLTIAQVAGTPASYVSTWFAEFRRLRARYSRGLSGAVLVVEYSISVPTDAPDGVPDIAAAQASVESADFSSLTTLLQANLDSEVGDGAYAVTVTGITATAINVASPTPPEGGHDGGPEGGAAPIAVGIAVVSAALLLGCGSLVVVLVWRRYRRQPARPGNDIEVRRDVEIPQFAVPSAAMATSSAWSEKLSVDFDDEQPPRGAPSAGLDPGSARVQTPEPIAAAVLPQKRQPPQKRRQVGAGAAAAGGPGIEPLPALPDDLLAREIPELPTVPSSPKVALLMGARARPWPESPAAPDALAAVPGLGDLDDDADGPSLSSECSMGVLPTAGAPLPVRLGRMTISL